MKNNLSKSKYTLGIRCKKLLWLSEYKKEEAHDMENESILENGNNVGDLARHLFGDDYHLIDYDKGFTSMIEDTKNLMNDKPNIICEASFNYDGNFCSVDILKNDQDGVEIYEVKSSTNIKDIYIDDITYQTWVLKKGGLKVKKASLIYINANYVKQGALDIHKLFRIKDVTDWLRLSEVEKNVQDLKKILNGNEPKIDLSMGCHVPYDCPFFAYCCKDLPKPNVFDVGFGDSAHGFTMKLALYKSGLRSFKDIWKNEKLSDRQNRQVDFYLHNLSPKIEKQSIKTLLDTFTYPLYFLDFESYQDAIPKIDGTRPYQQICFQYSLDYYKEPGGQLFHKEYLSREYDGDPMYGLCKSLCDDIPMNACVLVYNDSFEKSRLREMASIYPDLRKHLLNIRDHIKDLLPPFRNHDYYTKDMQGSASIKAVLPSIYPNEPSLDYHHLEQVHKGTEATNAYLSLKELNREEEEKLRENMLKYCGLDTYAMVKVYEKLLESVKEDGGK